MITISQLLKAKGAIKMTAIFMKNIKYSSIRKISIKFLDALNGTVDHVKTELLPDVDFTQFDKKEEEEPEKESSSLDSDLKWD